MCVICGINDLCDAFCEVSNRGEASEADIERALSGRITEASVVSTERKPAYGKPLAGLGVAAHNRYCAKGDGEYARNSHPFMEYWSDAAMSTVV